MHYALAPFTVDFYARNPASEGEAMGQDRRPGIERWAMVAQWPGALACRST